METISEQRNIRLTLAGLQAGCLGSLLMIGWWLMGEAITRRSPWLIPNLLATTFYGERAYRSGFIMPTWAGLAFPFVVYCATGVLFALLVRDRIRSGWMMLLAAVTAALAFEWLWFGIVLTRLNPMAHSYSPGRLILVSHLLYGVALARYPNFQSEFEGIMGRASEFREADSSGSDQEIPRSVT